MRRAIDLLVARATIVQTVDENADGVGPRVRVVSIVNTAAVVIVFLLPHGDRQELDSLINFSESDPKTYPVLKAPCTPGCVVTELSCSCTAAPYYWTATTYAGDSGAAWAVGFGGGDVAQGVKTGRNAVRAVRRAGGHTPLRVQSRPQ